MLFALLSVNIVSADACPTYAGYLTVKASPDYVPLGSYTNLSADLMLFTVSHYPNSNITTCTLKSAPDQSVEFFVNNEQVGSTVTNANGQAYLNYSVAASQIGSYNLYAFWRENVTAANAVTMNSLTESFNVTKISPSIEFSSTIGASANGTFLSGGGISLNVSLTSMPSSGQQISLYANKQELGVYTTGPDGTVQIYAASSRLRPGTYTFTLRYPGNSDTNNETVVVGTYTVPGPPSISSSSTISASTSIAQNSSVQSNAGPSLANNGAFQAIIVIGVLAVAAVAYYIYRRGMEDLPVGPPPE